MRRRTLLSVIALVLVAGGVAPAAATTPAAAASTSPGVAAYDPDGTFRSIGVTRLVDTRKGLGGSRRGPGSVLVVDTASNQYVGVAGVTALVLNVTVTTPTHAGYLTLYPGPTRPHASSINFTAGWTGANLVTVPVAPDGSFRIYNSAGYTQVIVDALAYYLGPNGSTDVSRDQYHPMTPRRVFDSRKSSALKTAGRPGAGPRRSTSRRAPPSRTWR